MLTQEASPQPQEIKKNPLFLSHHPKKHDQPFLTQPIRQPFQKAQPLFP
jgi:hypothetical protein